MPAKKRGGARRPGLTRNVTVKQTEEVVNESQERMESEGMAKTITETLAEIAQMQEDVTPTETATVPEDQDGGSSVEETPRSEAIPEIEGSPCKNREWPLKAEQKLCDLWKANPCLYNKELADYRNAALKDQVLRRMATELNKDGEFIFQDFRI